MAGAGRLRAEIAFSQAVINSVSEILDFGECTSSSWRVMFLQYLTGRVALAEQYVEQGSEFG